MTTTVRVRMRRTAVALLASLTMLGVSLSVAGPASASGTVYARYNTGYPNTYARITYYGDSIHTNNTKLFSVSCSYGCDRGWGEMIMNNGSNFRLWVDAGKSESHSFYSGVQKFRFCELNVRCTGWVT